MKKGHVRGGSYFNDTLANEIALSGIYISIYMCINIYHIYHIYMCINIYHIYHIYICVSIYII
jgi:hypothetical protein